MPDAKVVRFEAGKIDAIFASLEQCHLPGAAVGIAIAGRPVYRRSFGLASVELPVVLSPTMRMRIASMTKHFTALAYLLLCEEGKAGIDDPIGRHLPELHPIARHVTARQLMGHTGGLRDVIELGWQFGGKGRPVSSADLLAMYRDISDRNTAPGTCWIYNNGGFLMLSAAIERITGQSLEDVFRERIFEPAGMHDTLLRRWDTDFVSNSATLHMTDAAGRYVRSYLGMELTGDAGVVSTVDDMLRWLAHMDAPSIGTAATWNAMKTPASLANGTSTGYGLGLAFDRYRGAEMIYHDGGVMGGNSRMLKVPAASLDIVVLVNRQDAHAAVLTEKILDVCLPDLAPADDASRGPLVTGTFVSPTTGRAAKLFARDGQQIASIDGFDLPFSRDPDGTLYPISRYSMLKQRVMPVGDSQQPAALRFSDFGNLDELHATQPASKNAIGALEGVYRSSVAGIEATIERAAQTTHLSMRSRFGAERFDLEPLAERIWRAKPGNWWPPGGILSFDEAAAPTFRFFSARTRALRFDRVV